MKIKPAVFWPAVIAGALALHVTAMMIMVALATSNDSYAVEPDYYQKALAWNDTQAQDRRHAELGWIFEFTVEPAAEGADPVLRATLTDASGSPIEGAQIEVEAFSHVRRDEVLESTLEAAGSTYETTLPMRGNGLWEFRFTVTRDSDVFTYRETRHVWTKIE